jgi:hypothetical protein
MTDPNYDPLEGFDKTPAVSFDPGRGGAAEGEFITLEVTDFIKLVQAKDDNGKPQVYEDSGNPVMKAALAVKLNGEARTLWVKKNQHEGGLFKGLQDAQKAVKAQSGDPSRRLGPGCTIEVAWAWNTALPKKLGNHPKKYAVRLVSVGTPPPTGADPLGEPVGAGASRSSDPWGSSSTSSTEPPFLHQTGFDANPDALTV